MEEFNFEIKRLENNQVIPCEVIFTFSNNEINYVIYTDNKYDEDKNLNILASRYEIKDGNVILSNIEKEEEFDLIDQEIEKRLD